jgi:2-polyprenyl-6-methoxyphenol hydroxylase-like FAD-dependent oxidoreductase
MSAKTNPPIDGSGHALVIGGSMAGLLTARVLSEHFRWVTIVERDSFPENPGFRKGVPQSRHLHAFMMRGRMISDRLFPGLSEELEEAGAVLMDSAEDFEWLTPAGFAPRFPSRLPLLMCSRDLLEWTVRKRVAALSQVRFLQRTDVTGLLPAPDGKGVAAVKVHSRDGGDGEEILSTELLVDASGRNSNASRWLETLGYTPPEETYINAHLGYASRIYERPERLDRSWKGINVQATPPLVTRGGALLPLEGNRWMVTLNGVGGDYPPTDEDGFMDFARSLRTPMLYEAIKDAEPLSTISGYRDTANRRRHYEKLSRQPDNFLVTGDAACAFNPVYAQGMTTAALGAEVLGECLRESGAAGDLTGLSKRFQKRLSKANAGPWLMATGEDFRVRGVEGGEATFATRLTHRYMDRVLALSLQDLGVRRTFLEVFHMLKAPTALFGPGIALKVLRGGTRRVTEEEQTTERKLPEAA